VVVSVVYDRWLTLADPTVAALSFLLIVVVVAAASTFLVAAATSIGAAVAFNYFFLAPVGTFAIARYQDGFAFLTLLIVGGVVSRLSTRARVRAADAMARGRELERLLAVTRELADLHRQSELVRQSAELKSTLLSSLGHDLRTPLTALVVASDNLEAIELSTVERQGQIALIREAVARLARLFDRLVDMARVEIDAVVVEPQWIPAGEIVNEAARTIGGVVTDRLIVSDSTGDLGVRVDPRLTTRALSHVLENAARFAPPATPIEVTVSFADERLVVTVRDHGPGIAPPDLDRVFARGYRGAGAGPLGTGMGLAIARGLIAAQAGDARASNHPDGGAVFTLSVPAQARAVSLVAEEVV
jgi:K+-sensing histidine kinase KdpD